MNDRRIRLSNRLPASFQLKEYLMFKHLLAGALATALVAAPLAPAFAQAATEKTSAKKTAKATKAKKELTPQQQKNEGLRPKMGGLQKGKERQGPRRVPKIH